MKTIPRYIGVLVILAFTLFPFVWMISTSFTPADEVYTFPPRVIPKEPTLDGYAGIWESAKSDFNFFRWAWNSFLVAVMTTAVSMVIALSGGYAMSRFSFLGKRSLGYLILISQVLPGSVMVIPLYIVLNGMSLLNTHLGLVLAYVTFAIPFCTWMIKGFFDSIPRSLDESGLVEGCTVHQVFLRIVLPLSTPGIAATGIFSFIAGWNEYLFAGVFLRSYDLWTLSLGISRFRGPYTTDWATIMAGSVMIALPIVVLFLVLQRYMVSGMTAGAVKQ